MESSRRQLLHGLFGAAVAASCRTRDPTPSFDGQDMADDREVGHGLEKARSSSVPPLEMRPVSVLVVGGGMAGLFAARTLVRRGFEVQVLELSHTMGGTSRWSSGPTHPHPWGAHYVPVPDPEQQPELYGWLQEMGVLEGTKPHEAVAVTEPEERSFLYGRWSPGLFPFASRRAHQALRAFERDLTPLIGATDEYGRPAFALPVDRSSQDPRFTQLDRITFANWLDRRGHTDPALRWYLGYASRDDFGALPEQISAWYGLHYFAARATGGHGRSQPFLTWPEGNGRLVDHLVAEVGRERIRTREAAVRIQDMGPHVEVLTWDVDADRLRLYRAQCVVVALPTYVRRHVCLGTEESEPLWDPPYSPWMVTNVHLLERPPQPVSEPAWDNVIVDSHSLGYVIATHQTGPRTGATVWTHYHAHARGDLRTARRELQDLSWTEATGAVFDDLRRTTPNLERFVWRMDVMRWGHGMVRPVPGTLTSGQRLAAARPQGRCFFAHTDLGGAALIEEAVHYASRAADGVTERLRSERLQ